MAYACRANTAQETMVHEALTSRPPGLFWPDFQDERLVISHDVALRESRRQMKQQATICIVIRVLGGKSGPVLGNAGATMSPRQNLILSIQ